MPETVTPPAPQPPPAPAPTPTPPKPSEPPPSGDKGFPANTPVSDMTPEQRTAYDQNMREQNRQRAQEWKALTGDLTPAEFKAQLDDIKAKAAKHDALERELMSDKDKAVAEARDDARAQALATVTPRLVAAEFKAAAAGRIEPDRLATILEPLDLSKFVNAEGEVDTDKVAAFVNGVAPVAPVETKPKGPSSQGQGHRAPSAAGASVQSGRDLYLAQRKRA